MLYHAAAERRERRLQANLIQAIATGYGGTKSEKGVSMMSRLLAALRKD